MNDPLRTMFFHFLTLQFHHYDRRFEELKAQFHEARRLALSDTFPGQELNDIRRASPYPSKRVSEATLLLSIDWRVSLYTFDCKQTGRRKRATELVRAANNKDGTRTYHPQKFKRWKIPDVEIEIIMAFEDQFDQIRVEAKDLWKARGFIQRARYSDNDEFMATIRSLPADVLGPTPLPMLEDWYNRSQNC